jgi:predicted Fe-Mo cluster-binding NifX family protein
MNPIVRMLVLAFFTFAALGSGAVMAQARIAVAADSSAGTAKVSSIAARAPNILIFDAEGKLLESHTNPAASSPGSAGPALARWLADRKVQTLVAGEFGGNLSAALAERKIGMVTASGPASAAARGAKP